MSELIVCVRSSASGLGSLFRLSRSEGIPFSLIARRVGLSRERVRQLYSGTALTLVALNGERIAHDMWRWYFHSPLS